MTRARPIPDTITVHVPFRLVKRGGRKQMILPVDTHVRRKADDTLVKALARAFRWKKMLETGAFVTIGDLADHEKIASSYLTRILRLTLLAPEIVEAIVGGRQGAEVTLAGLTERIRPRGRGKGPVQGNSPSLADYPVSTTAPNSSRNV